MKRSLLSRVLAILMVLALAMTCMVACKKPAEESKEESVEEKQLVKLSFYTNGSDSEAATKVWAYLNEYLAATDAKVEIEPHYVAPGEYGQTLSNLLAAGTTQLDVVYSTIGGLDLQANANAEVFAPLNDVIKTYGKGILDTCPSFGLDSCTVNGILYGVPTMKEWGNVYAVIFNTDVLKHIGMYDKAMSQKWNTMVDWENFFYELKAARDADTTYGKTMKFDSYAYFNGAFTSEASEEYKAFMADNGLAALKNAGLFDHWDGGADLFDQVCNWWVLDDIACKGIGVNVPEWNFFSGKKANQVFNAFATDEYAKVVATIDKWAKDGLFKNYSDDEAGLGSFYVSMKGDLLQGVGATCGQLSIGWNNNLGAATTTLFTAECVPSEVRFATRSGCQGAVMTIAYCSKNIERSMEYLNLLYTDQTIIDTFRLGIEGVHWNKTADGRAEFTEIGGPSGEGWYNWYGVNYGGNFLACTVPTTQAADVLVQLASCSKIAAPSCGWDFDTTDFDGELSAMANTVGIYLTQLQEGQCADYTAVLAEFLDKLAADGVDKVMAGYQAQIDK